MLKPRMPLPLHQHQPSHLLVSAGRARRWRGAVAMCVTLAATAACSAAETSSASVEVAAIDMAITARENTARALRGISSTADFLTESATLAEMLSSMFQTTCTEAPAVCDSNGVCEPATQPCSETASVTVQDLQQKHQEIDDAIDKLDATLRDEVLIDANLVSESPTEAVYRIPADVLCSPEEANDATVGAAAPAPVDAGVAAEPDAACIARIEHFAPKLRLSSPGGQAVNVALLLGANNRQVAAFELGSDRLGFTVDLTATFAVCQELGESMGSLSAFAGKVQLELVRNAERDYSIRYNILEDIQVTSTTDGESITLNEAAQTPVTELRLEARDGAHGTITGTYDLGAVQATGPLNAFRDLFDPQEYDALGDPLPRTTYTGTIELLLAGLEGSLSYVGDVDTLHFRGLGFGDASTFLKHNGNNLFQLDLNPEAGRHFDLTFEGGGEHPKLTFSPSFDLKLAITLQALADQITDLPSQWLDNAYHFWFEGTDPTIQLEDNQVRVVNGTLHLDTEDAPDTNLTVAPGACLLSSAGDEELTSPVDAPGADGGAPTPPPDAPPAEEPAMSGPFGNVSAGACL